MSAVLLVLCIIMIWGILGLGVVKGLKISEEQIFSRGFIFSLPIVGAAVSVCLIQIISTILTVRQISVLYIMCIIGVLYYVRNWASLLVDEIKHHKEFLLIGSVVIIGYLYPVLIKGELVSIQNYNNDIIYYLSSMDWLKDHTITDQVIFSSQYPFYSCAEFMIHKTRFGFDLLGALFMCIFNLQAHQIYYMFTVTVTVMAISGMYFLQINSLMMSKKAAIYCTAISSLGTAWMTLITYQYAPQILGMGCLLVYMAFLLKLVSEQERKYIYITGLMIIGTLTIYAEYAVYLLGIFIAVNIMIMIRKEEWNLKINRVLYTIKAGLISFIINPIGMYIAFLFNVKMLLKTTEGSAGDPYNGNVLSMNNIIAQILGISKIENYNPEYRDIVMILLIVVSICCLLVVTYGLYQKKDSFKVAMIGILMLFTLYQVYFHSTRYAYGEFKHLSTITPFIIIICSYFADEIKFKSNVMKILVRCGYILLIALICFGSYTSYKNENNINKFYYFDAELMELEEAVKSLPEGTVFTVDNDRWEEAHGIVYALKDFPVKLSEQDSSYFHFFNKYDRENTQYVVRVGNVKDEMFFYGFNTSEEILWSNDKYIIAQIVDGSSSNYKTYSSNFLSRKFNVTDLSKKLKDGTIISNGVEQGIVLYGPYISIEKGKFDITLEYEIETSSSNEIGWIDVVSKEKGQKIQKVLYARDSEVTLSDIVFDNETNVEFRVYLNKGSVCRLKNIKVEKVSDSVE